MPPTSLRDLKNKEIIEDICRDTNRIYIPEVRRANFHCEREVQESRPRHHRREKFPIHFRRANLPQQLPAPKRE